MGGSQNPTNTQMAAHVCANTCNAVARSQGTMGHRVPCFPYPQPNENAPLAGLTAAGSNPWPTPWDVRHSWISLAKDHACQNPTPPGLGLGCRGPGEGLPAWLVDALGKKWRTVRVTVGVWVISMSPAGSQQVQSGLHFHGVAMGQAEQDLPDTCASDLCSVCRLFPKHACS